jgi:hypothetical protein
MVALVVSITDAAGLLLLLPEVVVLLAEFEGCGDVVLLERVSLRAIHRAGPVGPVDLYTACKHAMDMRGGPALVVSVHVRAVVMPGPVIAWLALMYCGRCQAGVT